MGEIATGLTTAIDLVKKLRAIIEKAKNAETLNLVADLNMALADLKMQIADLHQENLQLRSQLLAAKEKKDFRANITLRDGAYYFKTATEGYAPGPYCTGCFDTAGSLVLLSRLTTAFRHLGTHQCPKCKSHFRCPTAP